MSCENYRCKDIIKKIKNQYYFKLFIKKIMSSLDNIGRNLDQQFENHNYLPQEIKLEDLSIGLKDHISKLEFSVLMESGSIKKVPIIYLSQELWAERKNNWSDMRNEQGQEVSKPFMTLFRTSVKRGTAPLKYTIPKKKTFRFVKVPIFDGTLKGFDMYKVPQPVYIDAEYELRFASFYQQHVDEFYETIYNEGYSDGQGYLKVNGYDIVSKIGDASEDNDVDDISKERVFQVVVPITVYGKLIDPRKFEKVNTITKISIKITEK